MGKVSYSVLETLPEEVGFNFVEAGHVGKIHRVGEMISFQDPQGNILLVDRRHLDSKDGYYSFGMFSLKMYSLTLEFTEDTAKYVPEILNTLNTKYRIIGSTKYDGPNGSGLTQYAYEDGRLCGTSKDGTKVEIEIPFEVKFFD